jgi:hypothetical protein
MGPRVGLDVIEGRITSYLYLASNPSSTVYQPVA